MHADTPAMADSRVRGAWKIRLWDENDIPRRMEQSCV